MNWESPRNCCFHSPLKQELKPGARNDKRATFEVVPDAATIPGIYRLRVVTEGGITLPVVIAVDRLTQRPVAKTIDQLPVSLHGTVPGPTVVETTFAAKAGQKVMIEVDAQRIGSKLRPVVHLSHAKGRQLAWSWGRHSSFLAMHDWKPCFQPMATIRSRCTMPSILRRVRRSFGCAWDNGRLSIKSTRWRSARISRSLWSSWASPPHRMPIYPAQARAGFASLTWPGEGLWCGPRPFVIVSPYAEYVEQSSATATQDLPAGPLGVSGRLTAPYEEDTYRVPVTAGTKLRLEVWAERYGSPVDTALVVHNEAGTVLARAEDGTGVVDPVLDYIVPDKVTALVVGVVDALGRGNPRAVYRLTINPQTPETFKSDWKLTTTTQRVSLPSGGKWVVPVFADRRVFAGGIGG